MSQNKKNTTSISLKSELLEYWQQIAKSQNRTFSNLIETVLIEKLGTGK